MSIPESERSARLLLGICPGVGPRRFRRILEERGSAEAALEAVRAGERLDLPVPVLERLRHPADLLGRIAAAQAVLDRLGARMLVFGDTDYPDRLAGLTDPPPLLYTMGIADWRAPSVAIVGRRAASRRALQWAERAAYLLAQEGAVVVSGGAYGVDAAAHRGALEAQGQPDTGTTVCVLGGGLDRPYPARHLPLFERIATWGCVLSPFDVGTEPKRGHFLARNRLIAALADAVVVVEAEHRSGSLSTARWARALGRKLRAVPGSPGTQLLLRAGAEPLEEPEEIGALVRDEDPETDTPKSRSSRQSSKRATLTEPERRLLNVLARWPGSTPATLARMLGWSVGRVVAMLAMLEIGGQVIEYAGGRYEWASPAGQYSESDESTDTS